MAMIQFTRNDTDRSNDQGCKSCPGCGTPRG